jgi:site-specific DNA-methyltransferase (adenine-specific)
MRTATNNVNGETSLAIFERAAFMLEKATTVQACKEVKDLALTAADFARRKRLGDDAIRHARRYAIFAEIKMGEMLAETERAKGAMGVGPPIAVTRGNRNGQIVTQPTLRELGISKRESSEAQLLAAAPDIEREAIISGRKTRREVVRDQLDRKRWTAEALERRKHLDKLAQLEIEGIHVGDFRDVAKTIPDASVDLIFTDPPYGRESLHLFGELAEMAAAKLVPGGSFITYAGGSFTPEVLTLLGAHLKFHWQICVNHTGNPTSIYPRGVVCRWKSLWWFTRGQRRDQNGFRFVADRIDSEQEKSLHVWQQSTVEAAYLIERLVPPGGMVFDPCCGSGTTFAACQRLGRKCIACDLDPDAIAVTKGRAS